jgi:hypothetical protein
LNKAAGKTYMMDAAAEIREITDVQSVNGLARLVLLYSFQITLRRDRIFQDRPTFSLFPGGEA